MKYEAIQKNRSRYSVKEMAKVLKISRSGYYKWLKREPSIDDLAAGDLALSVQIKAIHKESRQTYGYLRVTKVLQKQGIIVNKKKVARLMRGMAISGLQMSRFRPKTTLSKHNLPISPDLVKRDFRPKKTNRIWVSDITYVNIDNKWHYLCSVIDLANREVVGWSLENHMRTEMVLKAVQSAIHKRGEKNLKKLIFHSDQGRQYASRKLRGYLSSLRISSSMSAKGNCYDNAVAESFFSTLKREEVKRKKYRDIEEARVEIFDYIEMFYNRQRVHSTLNYKAPMEVAA